MTILTRTPRQVQYGIFAIMATLFISACAPMQSHSPNPTASPTAEPTTSDEAGRRMPTPISSTEEAVAVAKDYDPRFVDFLALDPDIIGASSWYEVEETANGWVVTFVLGWGDCPAGCIDKHLWHITVLEDGTVASIREEGPEVPDGMLGK